MPKLFVRRSFEIGVTVFDNLRVLARTNRLCFLDIKAS